LTMQARSQKRPRITVPVTKARPPAARASPAPRAPWICLARGGGRDSVEGNRITRTGHGAMSTVLVTGGSGFIGSHAILQLLAAGHQVRATLRSLTREGGVRAMLKEGGAEPGDRLSFFAADLENDAGWSE